MNFSEILLQTRKLQGLSQEALADKIQVSRQAVSKWETGEAMPDMAKLLALADALQISLDALCGRETTKSAPCPPVSEQTTAPKSKKKLPVFLPVLLILTLLFGAACGFFLGHRQPPAAQPLTLPENITVSGVNFVGEGHGRLSFRCSPSVVNDRYLYQISFTRFGEAPRVFDVTCSGGVIADTVNLPNSSHSSLYVTLLISNGQETRAIPLASDLNFSEGSASWTPLTDS